jgi:hypothetical protein
LDFAGAHRPHKGRASGYRSRAPAKGEGGLDLIEQGLGQAARGPGCIW